MGARLRERPGQAVLHEDAGLPAAGPCRSLALVFVCGHSWALSGRSGVALALTEVCGHFEASSLEWHWQEFDVYKVVRGSAAGGVGEFDAIRDWLNIRDYWYRAGMGIPRARSHSTCVTLTELCNTQISILWTQTL